MRLRDRLLRALGLDVPSTYAQSQRPRQPPQSPATPRQAAEPDAPEPATAIGEERPSEAVLDVVQLIVEDYERWRRDCHRLKVLPLNASILWLSNEYRAVAHRRVIARVLRHRLRTRTDRRRGLGQRGRDLARRAGERMKADRVQEG